MRTSTIACLAAAALLTSCQMATRNLKPPPLDSEAEAWVYLESLPFQASRLRFTIDSVAATRSDGSETPLALEVSEVSGADGARQRRLAWGRIAPGEYVGLSLRVKNATLAGDEGAPSNLLVPDQAVRIAVPFAVSRARAKVVSLKLQYERSLDKGFGFTPSFLATVPAMPLPQLLGFATDTGSDSIVVFDKSTMQVVAALPTGRDPLGIAVDPLRGRVFVALSGADEVGCHDLLTGEDLGRARLQPGDRPQEVALSGDGRLLLTTNAGSNSVSFVDPSSLVEVERARTGIQPTALLVDRSGKRAYAFNQGSNSITVVDLAARAAAGTIPTEGTPARGAFNRAGDRMYVVSPSSAYMTVLSMPTHATQSRIYVGFGASSIHVDPRTEFAYVSMGDTGELQLFAPLTPLPVGRVALPGPATWLAIDDTFNRLLLVIPSKGGVASMEITSRKVLPMLEAGRSPYAAMVAGERR